MEYIGNCTSITIIEWERLMKGARKCSGRLLRKKIIKENPEIAKYLYLHLYNPFEGQCKKNTKTRIAIYVHSGIEYFFKY
jgi:hypothetical protein